MKIYGQLESACLEQLASDPGANVQGRIFTNTTDGKTKIDDGVNKRALLKNDEHAIIGNSVTPAENIRLHKGLADILQLVQATDATVDGTMSNLLAMLSARLENYLSSALPAVGNLGRAIYLTDINTIAIDNGTVWTNLLSQGLATTKGDILVRGSSLLSRLGVGVNGTVLTADSSQPQGMRWVSPGTAPVNSVTTPGTSAVIGGGTYLIDTTANGAGFTIKLPLASGNNGEKLTFLRTDNFYFRQVLLTDSTGVTTLCILNTLNENVVMQSDGTTWRVLSRLIPSSWSTDSSIFSAGAAWGQISNKSAQWRRENDSVHISLFFNTGNLQNLPAYLQSPNLTMDQTKILPQKYITGSYLASTNSVSSNPYAVNNRMGPVGLSGDGQFFLAKENNSSAMNFNVTATQISNSGDGIHVDVMFPVVGWSV